jgi:hypothetical protein
MYVTVRRGDKLPTVALAQARLVESGAPDLIVDGIFGPRTRAAVLAFQRKAGIPATGEVDPPTWKVLHRKHPITVIDSIDAGDDNLVSEIDGRRFRTSQNLAEERPYLDDGHSNVRVNYGTSRGTRQMIHDLLARHPPQSVALLRFHGHGGPGGMGVSGVHVSSSSLLFSQFTLPEACACYRLLGTIMKPYGSIELHGCRVGRGRRGHTLLAGLARTTRVPVTAGLGYQYGGDWANRFEGATITFFPGDLTLKAWCAEVFSRCQW